MRLLAFEIQHSYKGDERLGQDNLSEDWGPSLLAVKENPTSLWSKDLKFCVLTMLAWKINSLMLLK